MGCQQTPVPEPGAGDEDDDGSTSSTSSTTGTTDDDESNDGPTTEDTTQFVPTDDTPPVHTCDTFLQDCPEGEKCNVYGSYGGSWDSAKCVPIMGDDQAGEPCQSLGDNPGFSGLDTCAHGLLCWDVGVNAEGYCVPHCQGGWDDPHCGDNEGWVCGISGIGIVQICMPPCDPLAKGADCINTDNVCLYMYSTEGFVCVLNASGGEGNYGTECQYANSCNPGLFCAAADTVPNCAGSQGCCSEYCDLNDPNTCAGKDEGQECIPWFEEGEAPAEYAHVGGCAIPS